MRKYAKKNPDVGYIGTLLSHLSVKIIIIIIIIIIIVVVVIIIIITILVVRV